MKQTAQEKQTAFDWVAMLRLRANARYPGSHVRADPLAV